MPLPWGGGGFVKKLKTEEFEGGLNKSPQKQGRIFGGWGGNCAGLPEYIPLSTGVRKFPVKCTTIDILNVSLLYAFENKIMPYLYVYIMHTYKFRFPWSSRR